MRRLFRHLESRGGLNVLGIWVDPVSIEEAADLIVSWASSARQNRCRYVCVTGMHGVMEAQKDKEFGAILNNADLNVPDGMPLVYLGKAVGLKGIGRVFGPDLMLEVWKRSESRQLSHFYYGGGQGVAVRLAERMVSEHPGLRIAGVNCPPFRPLSEREAEELRATVHDQRPDILWVGLSTPKQERWMAEFVDQLDAGVMVGVGAAFDYNTGGLRRAPSWMQRSSLEWLYRLVQEPRRLYRRYLINGPRFLIKLVWQIVGLKRYGLETARRRGGPVSVDGGG